MPGIYHFREGSVPKLLGQPLRLSGHGCDEVCILLLIKSLLCCSKMWSREVPDYPCISQNGQTKLHPHDVSKDSSS